MLRPDAHLQDPALKPRDALVTTLSASVPPLFCTRKGKWHPQVTQLGGIGMGRRTPVLPIPSPVCVSSSTARFVKALSISTTP